MAIGENVGLLFSIKARNDSKAQFSEVDRDLTKLGGSVSGLGSDFASLANPVALFTAGITAAATAVIGAGVALFSLAKNASEYGSSIYDASLKTGLTAETLSSLKFAADQSGSSFENITGSIGKFNVLLGEAKTGNEKAADTLKKYGITATDTDGALAQAIKTIANMKSADLQAAAAKALFKDRTAAILPVIKSFDGDLPGLIAKCKELGVTLSDEDARAADEFGDTLQALETQAGSVGRQFATGFMPAITQAMKEISGSLANNKSSWRQWGETLGDIILRMTRGARLLFAVLKDLFSGDYSGTATAIALVQNAESIRQEELRKDRENYANSDDRPEWVIKQEKDIRKLGKTDEDDLFDADAQKKTEEERKKREQEEITARQRFLAANKESIQQAFEELQEITQKNYEDQLITAEQFHSDFEENERQFRVRMIELVDESFKIQLSQAKNATDREAIETEQRNAKEKIISDSDKRIIASEKLVTEAQKKNSAERIRAAEEEVNSKIAAAEAFVDRNIALIEAENIAESEKIAKRSIQEAALLKAKKHAYEELLEIVTGNANKEREVRTKINSLDAEITRNQTGNSKSRKEAIEAETKALIEWNKQYDARATAERPRLAGSGQGQNRGTDRGQEDSGTAGEGGFLQTLLTGIFGEEAQIHISDGAQFIKDVYADLADFAGNAIGSMVQGLGQLVAQWAITGKFSAKAALQMAAGVLAGLAVQAGVKAIFEVAEGFAAIARFDPASAALHFTAAKIYGTIALASLGAAVGAGALSRIGGGNKANSAFQQQTASATGSNTQNSRPGSGGAYSGRPDFTYDQSRNNPAGGVLVVRDKSGMFDQLFTMTWEKNGAMRKTLMENFGT